MPDIEISKIKVRRGTNEQRKTVVLDQGELGYTTDTKRLFVGNGVTIGGVVVGSKIHDPLNNYFSLSTLNAQVGDIVAVDKIFYQLIDDDYTNLNNWIDYKFNIDTNVFTFDSNNTLYLNSSSLNATYLNPATITNGLKIDSGNLQCNFQTKSLEISSLKLSIKASGIDEREISSSSFINGLSGGSGSKIGIKSNANYFFYDSTGLNLSGYNPFTLRFSDLKSNWFGSGLVYSSTLSSLSANITNIDSSNSLVRGNDGKIGINTSIFGTGLYYNTSSQLLSSNLATVDNTSIVRNSDGSIKIQDGVTPGSVLLSKPTIDQFGRVTSQTSSIYGALTGNSTTNSTNSLSSLFNGNPSHTIDGGIPGLNITTFTAISSDGSVVTLSSAGFITFEGPTTTQNGQTIGRFAIPIFAY